MKDVQELVKALLRIYDSQQALGYELGLSQGAVSRIAKGARGENMRVETHEAIYELARKHGLLSGDEKTPMPTMTDLIPEIDLVAGLGTGGFSALDVSTTNGITYAKEVVRDHWRLPASVLARSNVRPSNVAAMLCQGDSMQPTILDGDVVFVDTRHRLPSPPDIYALLDEFGGVIIKRLEVVSEIGAEEVMIRVSSDNPRHKDREVLLSDLVIVGRRIGRFTL